MANVAKKNFVDPAWPADASEDNHPVTEILSQLAGASSPYGNDLVLPLPPEQVGYVHPHTRINR